MFVDGLVSWLVGFVCFWCTPCPSSISRPFFITRQSNKQGNDSWNNSIYKEERRECVCVCVCVCVDRLTSESRSFGKGDKTMTESCSLRKGIEYDCLSV
ncbi:hypothetical protein GGR55DRAFT_207616 [Xylaria sp. FL0064]|nr:hypothetical protein GGR55DRAFT_207616 [Xylaria sp. FL0064]